MCIRDSTTTAITTATTNTTTTTIIVIIIIIIINHFHDSYHLTQSMKHALSLKKRQLQLPYTTDTVGLYFKAVDSKLFSNDIIALKYL